MTHKTSKKTKPSKAQKSTKKCLPNYPDNRFKTEDPAALRGGNRH